MVPLSIYSLTHPTKASAFMLPRKLVTTESHYIVLDRLLLQRPKYYSCHLSLMSTCVLRVISGVRPFDGLSMSSATTAVTGCVKPVLGDGFNSALLAEIVSFSRTASTSNSKNEYLHLVAHHR